MKIVTIRNAVWTFLSRRIVFELACCCDWIQTAAGSSAQTGALPSSMFACGAEEFSMLMWLGLFSSSNCQCLKYASHVRTLILCLSRGSIDSLIPVFVESHLSNKELQVASTLVYFSDTTYEIFHIWCLIQHFWNRITGNDFPGSVCSWIQGCINVN